MGTEHGFGLETLRRNVRVGAEALRVHRSRTALTTLGVVFGVAAVICMLAIGKGAERRVLEELRRLGIHNLHVESRPRAQAGAASVGLVEADAHALVTEFAPLVRGAAPMRSVERRAFFGSSSAEVRLSGVTPEYARSMELDLVEGRFISDLDAASGAAICVLSERLRAALVPGPRALGARVRCGGMSLRVVGVVHGAALEAGDRPEVFVPLSLGHLVMPAEHDPREIQRIIVHLDPEADPEGLAAVITAALARRHAGNHDFAVIVPQALIRKEQRTQRVFQIVMGGIAGISLLVGGIGIANILFASVVERTSEIGLRRAVGARQRDIATQFLFEAVAMGAVGGAVGIALGVTGALVIARVADWPVLVTPVSVLVSTGTALVTGLVAGVVPARAAAHVDAIVALHHE